MRIIAPNVCQECVEVCQFCASFSTERLETVTGRQGRATTSAHAPPKRGRPPEGGLPSTRHDRATRVSLRLRLRLRRRPNRHRHRRCRDRRHQERRRHRRRVMGCPSRSLWFLACVGGNRRSNDPNARQNTPALARYSHSIVAGGLLERSSATRFTPRTSLMIRELIVASRSYGSRAQSAVIASSEVTARMITGYA
jgi:hypothetical protein